MQSMNILLTVSAIAALAFPSIAIAQDTHDEHSHVTETSSFDSPLGPINSMCPVTTDEVVDPAFQTEYEGQVIGFCCRKCRTRFEENPESYLAELPMLLTVSMLSQDIGHDEGDSHSHDSSMVDDHEDSFSHDDSEEHDHATDHGINESGLARLISWLGKFHPAATHLPIGMLIGGGLAEGLLIMTKKEIFRNASAFCVVVASIGAIAAVSLGWFNGGFAIVDDQWPQTVHRWLGTVTAAFTFLSVFLLILSAKSTVKQSMRIWYRITLFSAVGLIGATGFFGGALVYGMNHYAW